MNNIKLKIANRRTRETRVLLLEEFKQEFHKELKQGIKAYSEDEERKNFLPKIVCRNKDYESEFFLSLHFNFNNYVHSEWYIERFI